MSVTLRRLTYRPVFSDLARALHAREILRRFYLKWVAPDGAIRLEVSGIHLALKVETAEEARDLDGTLMSRGVAWSERDTLERLLAVVKQGDVIYDVGANFGLYSVALGKRVGGGGKVIAFEPVARTYERLKANVQLNGLTNVACFRKALGEKDARVEIYVDVERPWCSTLLKRQPISARQAVEAVDVSRGDSLRTDNGLPVPRVVKIDVEGYEYSVIKGLRETLSDERCEYVACEVHPTALPHAISTEDVLGLLQSLGFTRINGHTRGPEEHIFCRKG